MMILTIRVEHPLDVTIERPHDPDPREHRRPTERRVQQKDRPKAVSL
jgi:hypothetical protein